MAEASQGLRSVELMAERVEALYEEGHTDYWLPALVLTGPQGPIGRVRAGDSLIFCCRRGEREIQLTRAFVDGEFTEFPRRRLEPLTFVPLTLYHPDFRHLPVAFAPQRLDDTLGEVISRQGRAQLRLAEKEKYAHVTYFFSGGRTEPFPGEVDRGVPSFLDDPPRALPLLLSALEEELSLRPTLAVVNVATGDIMGHYAELGPKVRCAEEVDRALGAILKLAEKNGYWTAVTADHGLLEDHGPKGGPPNVSHTTHPVPFLLVGPHGESLRLAQEGILGDVAPTLLELLNIPRPAAMTGRSLLLERVPRADRVLVVILDGWGLGKAGHVNPIELARTPNWDELSRRPMAHLAASGEAVGLLSGRKGNSEAGHMNLGAGRVVPQDEVRIKQAIETGTFSENPAFHRAIEEAQSRGGALHLLGLLSENSSHGSMGYVLELLKLARRKGCLRVFVHLITDGRSTQPGSAPALLRGFGKEMERIGVGTLVTLVGRGLALDRGGDYVGKTRKAYRALVLGEGIPVPLDN
ncbi:phosphoglycerate mutase (2,3-diphosphoglycerate-independent) [Candidatus Bipolaricaulota bacterium]|nr:phosphoglycerate mutase (2,3-diphosphoglycerate-independent) [Candidatus Bipolaricaulota bacterium]